MFLTAKPQRFRVGSLFEFYFLQGIGLGGSKALKARPVKAMGATHGHENRIYFGFWPNLAQSGKCRFAKTVGGCFFNRKGQEGNAKVAKRRASEVFLVLAYDG